MAATAADRYIDPHLKKGERAEASVRGVIAGFTRWSSVGGGATIALALLVPQALGLNIVFGIITVIAIITLGFFVMLTFVGGPMARRHDPPLSSPYVTLALTNRRLLLIERGTGKEASSLVEECSRGSVSGVSFTKGGLVRPHRLVYETSSAERLLEFPRMERVEQFASLLG